MGAEIIKHPFKPVFDGNSRILVLGTMPSPRSREDGFYYGHPQNRFWRVLGALFDEPVPNSNERKADFVLRHHIALWDVLASCGIEGASDASITRPVANDIATLVGKAPIEAIFCTGAKAAELYGKLCRHVVGIEAVKLPSTSAANASYTLDDLVKAYRPLLDHLHPYTAPVLDVPKVVELEQTIAAQGTSLAELMDRAGLALAHEVHSLDHGARIAVLCGSGNNGGDGWVAAADLAQRGHAVTLVTSKEPEGIRAQPASDAAKQAAAVLSRLANATVALNPDEARLGDVLEGSDIIIDAILGTGFDGGSVKEPYAGWIRAANERRARGAAIVSADVPSGLSAQTGRAAEPCISANRTVTMIVPKPGLVNDCGIPFCGTVHVAPLAYIEPLRAASETSGETAHAANTPLHNESGKANMNHDHRPQC